MLSLTHRYRLPPLGRNVWLLTAASAFLSASFMGMLQLLKAIYILRLGFGPEFTGLFFATGALSFSLSSIPGGILGVRLGPRRMMLAGAATMLCGMTLLPMAELIPSGLRAPWLLVAQIIASSGWSVYNVNQITTLTAFTNLGNRKTAFGFRESLAGLGTFLGALVGGVLPLLFASLGNTTTAQPGPYRQALIVTVLVGTIALIPMLRIERVTVPAKTAGRKAALPPLAPLAFIMACGFLNHSAMASDKVFYPAYLDQTFGVSTAVIGIVTSIGMALAIGAALAGAQLSRRRGSVISMTVAALGLAASLLLMAFVPHAAAVSLGAIGMLALTSVWMPAYQVRLMEMASPEQRGLVAGMGSMAMSLGFATMSFNGGRIAATAGYSQLFLVGAGLALACAALVTISVRVMRRPAEESLTEIPMSGEVATAAPRT